MDCLCGLAFMAAPPVLFLRGAQLALRIKSACGRSHNGTGATGAIQKMEATRLLNRVKMVRSVLTA